MCVYITKKCVCVCVCVSVCLGDCLDKYVSAATWPLQTKISGSAPTSNKIPTQL